MGYITIRFYEELNFFLPRENRKKDFRLSFQKGDTVKLIIESAGIPHTEVDLVLVNGESVGFSYQIKQDDRISVYPVFESFDIKNISKVRPTPLRTITFILDVHLGKLAYFLRTLGFDSRYKNEADDPDLAEISKNEGRILLTRDKGLLKRKAVTHGYYIKSSVPKEQLREVISRFDLKDCFSPFSRCLICNTPLEKIEKTTIINQIPEKVALKYEDFSTCPTCGRIYWRGSHWDEMKRQMGDILE